MESSGLREDDDSALPHELRRLAGPFVQQPIYDACGWYDVDYAGYAGDVAFYREVLRDARHVTEMGAGSGRLTTWLANADHIARWTAVEPAPLMRDVLLRRTGSLPAVLVADGTAATTQVERPQDAVMFSFNGMLHVEDNTQLMSSLANMVSLLRPGGLFAFDITGPYWDAMLDDGLPWGRTDERVHPVHGERFITADRFLYDHDRRMMTIDIRYVCGAERVEVRLTQRMWTYEEVLSSLHAVGLVPQQLWGDVDGRPWQPGSPRLLCSATRP
jgi:SAM-dependent methyltransferase